MLTIGALGREASVHAWANKELAGCDFGDARLNRRLRRMVEDFADQPNESVPQASGDWPATKAAYSFWDNDQVAPEKITAAQVAGTVRRASEYDVVLAVQDTSEANYSTHPATSGLGYGDNADTQVLKLHTLLCVSPEGKPLGMLGQQIWVRPPEQLGKRHSRRKRLTEEKESRRWLWGLETAQQVLPASQAVVTVGDREADIYDLFALPRREQSHLLVRVSREQRRVQHPAKYLRQAVEQERAGGKIEIRVPRRDGRRSRPATLTLRWLSFEIDPPRNHLKRSACRPVRVWVVLAQEEDPPAGQAAIRWVLVTTLAVETLEEAARCVRWYSYRWRIEQFHYVLKSGCQVERLELETAKRLANALATYSIVAWRLLWLTYEARQKPDASCEIVLETYEWQALQVRAQKRLSKRPPTLRDAVRMIARLGGFLGRKHDGDPGVKTIWRGIQRLHDLSDMWKLTQILASHPPPTYG